MPMRFADPFVLLLAAAVPAQATHVVGPGGFGSIDAALAAAAPGDIVMVAPGTWPGFTATRAVTIRAGTPGTAFVGPACYVDNAAGVVHLVDLDLTFLSVTSSTCVVDRCRVVATPVTIGPCLGAIGSTVRLLHSHVGSHGTPPVMPLFVPQAGLYASGSAVTAIDTTIVGRDRDSYAWTAAIGGGPGVHLANSSTLHASGGSIEGGDGYVAAQYPPGSAVVALNSTFWIVDASLRCGRALGVSGTPRLGCPVVSTAGRLARCTFDPTTCPPTVPTSGAMVGARLAAPMAAGAPFQVDFHVEPNEFVGVFASLATAHYQVPGLEQPGALDLGRLFVLGVMLADGQGLASGAWSLPPATANLQLWLQGVTTAALPMQVSPLVGGVIR
jgi:hypothetical protein